MIDDLYALGGGAAVYSHNSYISFNSNVFCNNSAARGGGLGFYDSNTFARVFKCLIEGNKVSINGGGMYMVFDNMNMHIEDCFFMNNSAEYGKYFVIIINSALRNEIIKLHCITLCFSIYLSISVSYSVYCRKVVRFVFGQALMMCICFAASS